MSKKLLALILGAITGHAIAKVYVVRKVEQRKREMIYAEGAKNIEAIYRASARIQERIQKGEYNKKGLGRLLEDFDFEIIASHYE